MAGVARCNSEVSDLSFHRLSALMIGPIRLAKSRTYHRRSQRRTWKALKLCRIRWHRSAVGKLRFSLMRINSINGSISLFSFVRGASLDETRWKCKANNSWELMRTPVSGAGTTGFHSNLAVSFRIATSFAVCDDEKGKSSRLINGCRFTGDAAAGPLDVWRR